MAPYWKASWLTAALPCEAPPADAAPGRPYHLMYHRNLRRIGRRYTRDLYMKPQSHPRFHVR